VARDKGKYVGNIPRKNSLKGVRLACVNVKTTLSKKDYLKNFIVIFLLLILKFHFY